MRRTPDRQGVTRRARVWGGCGAWLAVVMAVLAIDDSPEMRRCTYLAACFKYVTWPEAGDPGAPYVLGIVGPPPFGPAVSNIFVAQRVNDRNLTIRVCDPLDLATNCHVVFVGHKDRRQVASVLDRLKGLPVWTVGESKEFIQRGGIMNFVVEDKLLVFEYSREAYFRWRSLFKAEVDSEFLGCALKPRD